MKKLLAFTICILLLFGDKSIAKDKARALDSIMTHWTGLAKFNGTAMVVHHGKKILYKGYGLRAVDYGNIDPEKTLYVIGGATEMFTSALIFKLQEEKKLSINDTLAKYLPGFPNGHKITIRQLLAHQSGISDYMKNDSLYTFGLVSPMEKESVVDLFKNKPLAFEPGTQFQYSTSDYFLLGLIIEQVTGMDYYAAMHKYVFDPLEIKNSGFDFGGFASWDKAQGYSILNTMRYIPSFPADSTISYAAAGIFTSADGLYKLSQAMLYKKYLDKNSWKTILTPQSDNYAYGWEVKDIYGKKAYGHTGETSGFLTTVFTIPEDSTTILLMSNDFETEIYYIFDDLAAALYDQPYVLPKQRQAVFLEQRKLESYEGRYEFEDGVDLNVFAKDKLLWGQLTGQKEFTMLADVEPDEFFMSSVDIEFKFIRDKKTNLVTDVIVRQNRKDSKGHKWQ